MAREVIKKGDDVRGLRKTLNSAFAGIPTKIRAEGAATSTSGDQTTFSVVGEDIIYIKLDSKTGTSPIKYAWTAMVQDRDTGAWVASPRVGLTTDDSYAVELNNTSLTTGGSTRYPARVNPQSGKLTFRDGGGSGSASITSGETVLMILGDWTDYELCPDAPPAPPMTYANPPCDLSRSETPCVPAYAFAVYQRCGYVWNKVGDSRTSSFGVWATELNGSSTTAWRRFVIPRWGGDIDPITRLPDPLSDCMGVAFLGSGAGALTCSCPSWATTDQCLKVTYTVIDRPFETGNGGYSDCNDVFLVFDAGDAEGPYWGRTFTALINQTGSLCSDGSDGSGPLTFAIVFEDTSRTRCYWGPDVFDPCDPCAGFGRFYVTAEINDVAERPNCAGAGHFTGYLTIEDIKDIICNCATKALREMVVCNGCDGSSDELPPLHFIDLESVEFTCCDEPTGEAIFGGTAGTPAPDGVFGGTAGAPAPDIYDGGGA